MASRARPHAPFVSFRVWAEWWTLAPDWLGEQIVNEFARINGIARTGGHFRLADLYQMSCLWYAMDDVVRRYVSAFFYFGLSPFGVSVGGFAGLRFDDFCVSLSLIRATMEKGPL